MFRETFSRAITNLRVIILSSCVYRLKSLNKGNSGVVLIHGHIHDPPLIHKVANH